MPFAARYRHEYWSVDIRYIDNDHLGPRFYCISVLENYSRAILASGLSRTQNLGDFLMVFYAAVRQHGAPDALVSDGGGVFRAKQAQGIYEALGVTKREIERRQAWQNYIEAQFSVQRRMADWHFAKAETWDELLRVHDQWVVDFNFQSHWAHRQREDGRQSPAEVLGWVCGAQFPPEDLDKIFRTTRFGRTLERLGYARFRHFRLYAEEGLTGERAAIWLYGENLTLQYADDTLATYKVRCRPGGRELLDVSEPRLFDTPHRSAQPHLWELGEAEWLKVVRVPEYARRRCPTQVAEQSVLLEIQEA